MNDYCVVLVTASNRQEAETISHVLVEKRVAACVNLIPLIRSEYWWEGKIEQAEESLLVIKTLYAKLDEVTETVKAHHSYTVPEVIALPIVKGNPDYLQWITDSLT